MGIRHLGFLDFPKTSGIKVEIERKEVKHESYSEKINFLHLKITIFHFGKK